MKKFLLLILLITLPLFLFKSHVSYRMPPAYNYDSDFGRDLWVAEKITQGKFTLVGPQFSFSGLRLAPYHFYFLAPFLLIFNSYKAVVIANAVLFVIALMAVFLLLFKKYGGLYSSLAVVWLATSPFIIASSRTPGNAFTYLAFYMVYFVYIFLSKKINNTAAIILGLTAGVMVNYHPVSFLVVIAPYFLKAIFVIKNVFKIKLVNIAIFLTSFVLTFLPAVAFEIKHGFVITKSLMSPKMGEFITGDYVKKIATWSGLTELNNISFAWAPLTLLGLFLLLIVVYLLNKKKELKPWFLLATGLVLVFAIFGRTISHYFFPTLLFLQLIVIFFLNKVRYSKTIIAALIFLNIIFFPVQFYREGRNLETVENNFNVALNLLELPKNNINTLLVNDTHLSAPAYEYRYLLLKNGTQVDDESSYDKSQYLLLISEKGDLNWKNSINWEMKSFGSKKLIGSARVDNFVYYLFSKQ